MSINFGESVQLVTCSRFTGQCGVLEKTRTVRVLSHVMLTGEHAGSHVHLRHAEPLNILLIQPGDPRHVLKTIASRFRHSKRPLHVRRAAY